VLKKTSKFYFDFVLLFFLPFLGFYLNQNSSFFPFKKREKERRREEKKSYWKDFKKKTKKRNSNRFSLLP